MLILSLVSAQVLVSSLTVEPAPRVSLTVLANTTTEPGHFFVRYSAGISGTPGEYATDLQSAGNNTIYLNNSEVSVRFSSDAYSIGNATHEGEAHRQFFGSLESAPWWDYSFEKRRSIVLSESSGVFREGEPVTAQVYFNDEAYDNSLRLRYWDGNEHVAVPFEILSSTMDGDFYTAVSFMFVADVPANGASKYQLYYSSSDAGTESYTPMLLNRTSTHLVLNDTLQVSFRLGNQSGEGEIDSLVFGGSEFAEYNSSGERGAYSFEMFTADYGRMRPTDNRNDENILFRELVVEENTPVRTVIRRTSILKGTLNERYFFYAGSRHITKETEFFPFETLDMPATSFGAIREPDSAVPFPYHNNTNTWGGLGTRLSPGNWTTWYDGNEGIGFFPRFSTLTLTDEYLLSDRVVVSYNNTDSAPMSLSGSRYDFDSVMVPFNSGIDMEDWYVRLNNPAVVGVSEPEESVKPQLFSGPISSRILYQPLSDASMDVYRYVSVSAYRPEVRTEYLLLPKATFDLEVSLDAFNISSLENVTIRTDNDTLSFSSENRTLDSFLGDFSINNTRSCAVEGAKTFEFSYDGGVLSVTPYETFAVSANSPMHRRTICSPSGAGDVLLQEGATYHVDTSDQFSDGMIFQDSLTEAHFFFQENDATIMSLSANLTPLGEGWLNCSLNRRPLFNFTDDATVLLPVSFLRYGNNTLSCLANNNSFEFSSVDIALSTVADPGYVWGGRWNFVPLVIDWHKNSSDFVELFLSPDLYGLGGKSLRALDSQLKELPIDGTSLNTTLQPFRRNTIYLAYSTQDNYETPVVPGAVPASPGIKFGVEGSFRPRATGAFISAHEEFPIRIMPAARLSGSSERVFVDPETGMGAVFRLVIWS